MGYSLVHFQREFWSLGKPYLTAQHPELPRGVLSTFEFFELFAYGFCLYLFGVAGDRYSPRKVLAFAFTGIGIFFALLSFGGFSGLVWKPYYYFVFIGIGVFNSFLLPSMIAVVGQWFGKKHRGLIVGGWQSCNNFGDIVGIQLAAVLLFMFEGRWEVLQAIAALMVMLWAIVVYFFLVPHPNELGLTIEEVAALQPSEFKAVSLNPEVIPEEQDKPETISFLAAWRLPGVILYGSIFFCTKLAVYCLLFQLPTFLKTSSLQFEDHAVANLSTLQSFGAMTGSVTLGYLSDLMGGRRSPVALGAISVAIIALYVMTFEVYQMSHLALSAIMFLVGFCLNGLNNLISSACSADLGKQEALKGNARAISTVTGIIDGTGTMGSAIGQLILSYTSPTYGWQYGYLLVIAIDMSVTLLPVLIIFYKEMKRS